MCDRQQRKQSSKVETTTDFGRTAISFNGCLTSTETIRLIRDGKREGGRGYGGGGEREIINLSLHCHHQNDSCIKMGYR